MTSEIRMWTFAGLIGLLAATDWFVAAAPADPDEDGRPRLTLGKATVTVVAREIERDGKKERRAFLEIGGDAAGTVKVRLLETRNNPMSRMPARPSPVWEKDIAVDSAKAKSIDLALLPKPGANIFREIVASTDGKTWLPLLSEAGGE